MTNMRRILDVISEGAKGGFEVFKAPDRIGPLKTKSLFLAGSIDMGEAENWQEQITRALSDLPIAVFNPRRDDWDSSWEQDISNDQFREQVEWELQQMERSDVMCVYFDKDGKAPITLMELGLHARSGKVVVCCPEGYWRRGNVQVVCAQYGIKMVADLPELIIALRERLV